MIAKNCTAEDLSRAAKEARVNIVDFQDKARGGLRFRLGLYRSHEGALYQRKSAHRSMDQRVNAVCWHGHAAFFKALFARCPEATVNTGLAKYNGQAHFLATFEATGNIGRPGFRSAREACFCGE